MSKIKTLNRIVVGRKPVTTENVWINTTKDTPTISVFENNKWKEVANAGGGSGDVKGDIIPAETGKYTLGDESHKYSEAHIDSIYANVIQASDDIYIPMSDNGYFEVNNDVVKIQSSDPDEFTSIFGTNVDIVSGNNGTNIYADSITCYSDEGETRIGTTGISINTPDLYTDISVISKNGKHNLSKKVDKVDPVSVSIGADEIPNLDASEVHELINLFVAGQNPRIISDNRFGSVVSADIKHNILIISMIDTYGNALMYYKYIATDDTHVEKSVAFIPFD